MDVICDWCGKDNKRKPSKVKKHKHFFCDRKCKGAWQRKNCCGENGPLKLERRMMKKSKRKVDEERAKEFLKCLGKGKSMIEIEQEDC